MSAGTYQETYGPITDGLDAVAEAINEFVSRESLQYQQMEVPLTHILSTKGKNLRSGLTLLSSQLWGCKIDKYCVDMATAVELLHIATLIHDDTIDRSDRRRGSATPSNIWGSDAAVLLGDYIFAASATFVCGTDSVRLIKRFAETVMYLSRGELREIVSAWDIKYTRDEYMNMIEDKTASLFATAAESGAVLGKASEEDIKRLRRYGTSLGIAYQIIDDLLDYEATDEQLGKPVSKDLSAGLLTLPAIIAIETEADEGKINMFLEAEEEDKETLLQEALNAINASGAKEETRRVANSFIDDALEALENIPDTLSLQSLKDIAVFCRTRKK